MSEKYKDQVQFLLVYVREAHATDGWQAKANERDRVLLAYAETIEQKEEHATACARKLDIRFPVMVDKMDNKVERDYTGMPDRLYLVGRDGRIAWKGDKGPAGFRPPELEAAIQKELGLPVTIDVEAIRRKAAAKRAQPPPARKPN